MNNNNKKLICDKCDKFLHREECVEFDLEPDLWDHLGNGNIKQIESWKEFVVKMHSKPKSKSGNIFETLTEENSYIDTTPLVFEKKLYHVKSNWVHILRKNVQELCGPIRDPNDQEEFLNWIGAL